MNATFKAPLKSEKPNQLVMLKTNSNSISNLFFSDYNVDVLQDAIRYLVWSKSDQSLKIGRQSDTELKIVMRSIYLTHAMNDESSDVAGQVKQLNTLVLNYCVPQIIMEGRMYKTYIADASRMPVPLDRGNIYTTKGDKTLDMSRLYTYDPSPSSLHSPSNPNLEGSKSSDGVRFFQ